MSGFQPSVEAVILSLLSSSKKPLSTEQICSTLNIPKNVASATLYNLLRRGLVKRVYTETYDPTRPFDTASWTVDENVIANLQQEAQVWERSIRLVISLPLLASNIRASLLNKYEALDIHEAYSYVVEEAERELKIMCPIIDAYALYPLISRVSKVGNLKVKILTEFSKSIDSIYLLLSSSKNFEIKNAEKYATTENSRRRAKKLFGIHAKIIIADDKVALLGTFNLSKHHYLVNFDIGFLIYDQHIIKTLSQLFDTLWELVE